MPRRDELGVIVYEDSEGLIVRGAYPGTIPTTASKFAVGCEMTDLTTGKQYYNAGTVAAPVWNSIPEVNYAEQASHVAITANDDGLTTAIIPDTATFVTVTSAGATKAVTLPSGAAEYVGKKLEIYVGANGLELLTPAASNATVNGVDSDGSNQVDIPANTLSIMRLVAVNTWLLMSNTALGAVGTALVPDND